MIHNNNLLDSILYNQKIKYIIHNDNLLLSQYLMISKIKYIIHNDNLLLIIMFNDK